MKKRLFIGMILLALLILAALGTIISTGGDWCSLWQSPFRWSSCRSWASSGRSAGWRPRLSP